MDLMVGATYENIMMVEGEMSEVSELDLLNAMKAAHEAIKVQSLSSSERIGRSSGFYRKTRILPRSK